MSQHPDLPPASMRTIVTLPRIAAAVFLMLTMATVGNYGFYGDELYYIACSKHLAFGYVDHPPLVAILTGVATWLMGETQIALRVLSGLAGAVTVLLTARLAGQIGGGKSAQALAALSICCAPAFPALTSYFSMNPVDIMLCTLFISLFLKAIDDPSGARTWIFLGLVAGIGLLNKYTFLVLGFASLMGLLIARRWDVLKSPWPYGAGVIAALIFLPHVIWQVQHGWPTLEFMHNATVNKHLAVSPLMLLGQLTLGLNPFAFPLWTGGVVFLLLSRRTRDKRVLGWAVLLFIAIYYVQNVKFYYVLPVFPFLLAAGAVVLERLSQNARLRWPIRVLGAALTVSGIVLLPFAVPLLPPEQSVAYAESLGLRESVRMEKHEDESLPLHFSHRLGWEEVVDSVASVYYSLPVEERNRCAILASWYGLAGAVDHYGSSRGLPPAICPHNNYWLWGTRGSTGDVMLVAGYGTDVLREAFESVELAAYVEVAYDDDTPVFLCRGPRAPMEQFWAKAKRFI